MVQVLAYQESWIDIFGVKLLVEEDSKHLGDTISNVLCEDCWQKSPKDIFVHTDLGWNYYKYKQIPLKMDCEKIENVCLLGNLCGQLLNQKTGVNLFCVAVGNRRD